MHPYLQPLTEELYQSANSEKAVGMKAYMKNQFEFLGIPTPERRITCKEYVKRNAIAGHAELQAIVKELWSLPEREFQYCGIEILLYHKKLWRLTTIGVTEYCLVNKSWWDTVDFISNDCAGSYFKMFPDQIQSITKRWNHSENFWLQRASLLFQKSYKKATDSHLLSNYILHLSASKEFFVQKAIGWILREYAKTNPGWVKDFVKANKLAPLSQREAMKHL